MRALYYLYQFGGLFIYCWCVPNPQKQWSTSLAPKTATVSTYNNILRLLSIDETCQGVILNQWWILSTFSCLTKLKYVNSDISKAINKEGILHGDKICLHPRFNPRDGKYSGKEVIGMILLEVPIKIKEIVLPQYYNILRKSCFPCVYQHCSVYQSQKHTKFENNVKKLSVKFLDISFCRHQNNHMHKSNNLCIWNHQKEDCWIQQGSPVLCTFGSHWELVGLVSESSMACENPILVIKTAPYLPWIRWLINMNEKFLDPIFSSLCSSYPGVEHDLSNDINHANISYDGLSLQSLSRLITSSQNRQRRNPPPVFSISNNKDSFPGSRQLYFQGDHLSSASKFPMAHPWTTIFKTLSTSKQDVFCSNHVSNHFECIIHSETQIPKVTYTSSYFPQRNVLIYQNGIIASLLRQWADLIDAETVFHPMSINSVTSMILFSKQFDGFQGVTEIYSLNSQIKPSNFPFLHQFAHGSWSHISPDIGSWTQIHTMSYGTETVMWTPFHKEITQIQTYYIAEKLSTRTYLVTYSLYPWDSLLVNKIERLTHSIVNDYGSQYSSLTPKLGPDFYNLVRSQITTTKLDGYMISPVPMRLLHSSTLIISSSLSLSKSLDFMSWSHYKPSYVISSSQLDANSLLSKHEDTIIKPLKQTENTAWPLFHSNNIRPLIYSKSNIIHPWAQFDSDLLKLRALSETESEKYLHTPKADKVRLWLEIKPEVIKPKMFHKSEIESPGIKTRETKIKYWMKSRIHTIKSSVPKETETVVPWNQAEADAVRYWYWPKPDHTLQNTLTNVNSLNLFTYLQVDLPSSWTESIGNIEHRKKTELFLLRPWVHSQSHNIIHQTKPEDNNVVLFQAQARSIWSHYESPVNHYLSKMKDEKMLPMYQSQMDTIKTWIQRKLQITPSWMKHEDDKSIFFTQIQETTDKQSFHNKMETVLKQTQPLTQLSQKWILSEPELHSLWKPVMTDKLRNSVHHEFDTVKSLNELNVGIIKPRVYKEARPLKQWMQAEYAKVNPHKSSKADIVMVWSQAETPLVIDWLSLLEDTATTSLNSQFQKLKDLTQSKNNRATRWTQTEAPIPSPWMLPGVYTLTSRTTGESSNIIPLAEPLIYTMQLWTQNEPTKKSRSITDALTYWSQTKISATSLRRKPLRNKTKPGPKTQPNRRNSLELSESYLTSLWTKDHFPTLNYSVEFQSKIGTVWVSDEYSTPNLWKQIEVDRTQLTYTELPLETLWTHQVPDTTIFNFTNSPSLINLMNPDYDVITTWSQAKTQSVNPWNPSGTVTPWTVYGASVNNVWSQTKYDMNSPQFQNAFTERSLWTQARVISELAQNNNETINKWTQISNDFKKTWKNDALLALTSFTEMETDIFTPFIQTESPTTNPWTQHGSDRVTLWNQPIYPTRSQWTGSIPPTETVWLNSSSPFVNLWLQQISDRLILSWPHVQSPSLNLQSQSVTYTAISQLIQAEYAPFSLWRKPETDVIIAPWPQPELSNQETQPLSDTKLQPWSEPELIPKYQWIITVTHKLIPQWSQDLSSTINMRSPLIFDTLLISTTPWPLKQTLETNLRTLPVYEKKTTAGFQSEYSISNTLILSMTDKVILHWSHSNVLPAYLWRWPISDTMMQSWTQDEYSVKNQRSEFLFDAITSSLSLDNSPATMLSRQLISDAFVLSGIQVASPKVNLFGLQLPDSIILPWPQSIYSSVNSVGYSGPDKIVPLWPKVKYSQTNKKTSSVSDIIMPHLFHEATWEGNRWPWNYHDRVTPTWTQIGSPKLSLWALIDPNRESSSVSPSRNILSSHSAVIIAQSWPHTRSPIFSIWLLGVSVTISLLHQTESTAGNIWPFPLSDTITTMLTHSGSLPVHLWTVLPSNSIPSTWPHPEPAKLWTLPIFNRNKPALFQTESKKLNTQTLFVSNTYIQSWDLSKYQRLIPGTGIVAHVLSRWTKSGILIVNSWTEPASYTTQDYVLTPEVKHWTHLISDPALLRNQATSPTTKFWEKYGADTFTEWDISQFINIKHPTQSFPNILKHVEISTTDPWTKVETDISQMSQPNSSNRNIWSQILENTVTSLFQSVSLISIPWTKFQSNTIRMKNQSESSVLTYWTQSISDQVIPWSQILSEAENPTLVIRGTETSWKFPKVVVLKSWNQSTTDIISQWITDKSSEIHVFPTAMFDKVILFDHAINPLLSQWTETEADAVREVKYFNKYVQTNSHHKIVTKWGPSEFSDKMIWIAPETGTAVGWQQGISTSFSPRKEYIAKEVKVRIQTESSAVNHFAKLVASTLTTQTQGELTTKNIDMQHVFDKVTYITEPKYPLTHSWIQKENVALNTKEMSENHWVQPATETVRLCIYTVYSTLNYLLQTQKLVTGWSQADPQKRKNHWDKANLSNIIHFMQNEYLSTYPCINDKIYKFMPGTQIQYIPEYHWSEATDSKVVSWSETDSFLTNIWKEAMFSKVMYWNQFHSLSVNPSTRKRASVLIQKEFPTEDTWIGSSTPNGIHWIQGESSLEQSETVSLTSIAVNWTQFELIPVVPWTQSMDLRYPLINKLMLSSYNHIIWTHPKSLHLSIPMSSLSKTLTPLALDENHLKNHWTESEFENLITLTKVLSVSEKLLTEGLFSTVLPWTKFLFSSEITSIHSNFNAITPRALANISAVISTCILSDNHICRSWNHDEFLKSKLKMSTSSIVKQNFQSESPLDLLEPKVSSRFTAWRLDELLLQTDVTVILSTTVAQTQTESLGSEIWPEIVTNNKTSLNSTEFTPVYFYMHNGIDKSTILTVVEIEGKNILTVSTINIFRISMQTQPYATKQSSQTAQTLVPLASTETVDRNTWSFSELGSLLSWSVPVPSEDFLLYHTEYHIRGSWFKTSVERKRPWVQPYYQTISIYTSLMISTVESWVQHKMGIKSCMNSATGLFNDRTQCETENVRLGNVPKNNTVRPWFHAEATTDHTWFHSITNTVMVLTQTENQEIGLWTVSVSDILSSKAEIEPETSLYIYDNNAVSYWFPIPNSLSQRIKIEPGTVTPWIQKEWQIVHQRNRLETKVVKSGYNFEANTSQIILTYSESGEIIPWTQPESPLVRRWPEDAIVTLWTLTKSDENMPLSQLEYKAAQYLLQHNFGGIKPWIQHKALTETLETIPWTHSDTVLSSSLQTDVDDILWSLTQRDAIRQLSQVEYEAKQSLTRPDIDVIIPWIQHKDSSETVEVIPWTHSDTVISDSIQTQIDFWSQNQIDAIRQWSQVEYKAKQSLAQPNVGIFNPSIQYKASAESLEIIPWTHSDIILSHILQTQIDSILWTLTQIDFDKLRSQVEYENVQSLVHQNVGVIHSWIQHKDSTETVDIFSWTYSHRVISYSLQTQIDLLRLWNKSQPMTAQIWKPTAEQRIKPDALTAVFTISPSFQVQEMLLSEEPTPVLPPQSNPQDKHSLEPLSTTESKLNISLSECHLGMIWNDNLQTLWLYKTAVVSHDSTECGIRPGLVPHCPDCWEAEIGEFPWMVSVQLSYSHFCAGSILNEMWVLTSARCANFIKRSESLALVQVGLIDLQDPTQGETVGIQRSVPYVGPRGPFGPGLFFLKEPIHFQPLVLPICLEESQEQERHIQLYDCWLPSWSLMRGSPGILQKRHLSIMQVSTCSKFWPQLNEFTFCVKAKKAMGESGCKGDLGAPLVCHLKQKDTWMQVGILIQFDEHCTKPYVFSQVSPFVFWLQRVTQPSHAPWSHQRPVITSPSNTLSVSNRKDLTFMSLSAAVHPHFISLPQPQALADHISVQYSMPWQAIIFGCGNQICSGSIISSYWVLTAAHCVRNMNPEDTLVILGLRHPKKPLRVVKVTTILLHERFRLVTQAARNDLALVLLREGQSSIHIIAPLGSMKNLNISECWLSGPQILKQGYIFENLDMLQIQVMGASKCAYLYPDIGSSTVCYSPQAGVPVISIESVSPGSAVMCRPLYGNRKWRQIGFTSLKHLATIIAPHFSWILSSTAKSGYPLDPALIPWLENSKSSRLVKHPTTLLLSIIMIISVKRVFIL